MCRSLDQRCLNLVLNPLIVPGDGDKGWAFMCRGFLSLGLVILILAGLTACSESEQDPPPPAISWYQDVKPIFDAYCNDCHAFGGIAPFSLDSLDAVRQVAALIPSSINQRRMPPFLAAPARRPLKYDLSLSDEQIRLVNEWIELGLPAGDAADPAVPLSLERSVLSRVDISLGMPEPYTPTMVPDEYRCFVLDWLETETKYITGFNIQPGNFKLGHHAAIFIIDSSLANIVDEADGADSKGLGYPCFGSAAPPLHEGIPNKLLAAWTPGSGGLDFPDGTGIRIQPGDRVILQMHYSVLESGVESDQTIVEFSVEDNVSVNAGNLPWLDIGWPSNPQSMLIEAGNDTASFEHVGDPTLSPLLGEFAPGVNPTEGLLLYGLLPHMHKLGKRFWLQLERADGTTERFFEITQWDFDWQSYYVFDSPITILPNDQLRLHCTFDNSAANQPFVNGLRRDVSDITWGEGSDQEMCTVSMYVHGIATNEVDCGESAPANEGQFNITFDTSDALRNSSMLDGRFVGSVYGSIYRAQDVSFSGPNEGAEPVVNFDIDQVDLTEGSDGPHLIDTKLPAGDYQFLGFMDTDGNQELTNGPDLNDPIMIPSRATALQCANQSVTIQFPLLLPDL